MMNHVYLLKMITIIKIIAGNGKCYQNKNCRRMMENRAKAAFSHLAGVQREFSMKG